jgi:hypothetical protein
MQPIHLPGPLVIACDDIDVIMASQVTVYIDIVNQIDLSFCSLEAQVIHDMNGYAELIERLAESGESFTWSVRAAAAPLGHLLASGPVSLSGGTLKVQIEAWGVDAQCEIPSVSE